jgi:hypothetical protein
MLMYDDMTPGLELGSFSIAFDEDLLRTWCAMFPADEGQAPRMPAGMAVMVMMRSYMEVLSDRPPGNIHAGQRFKIIERPLLGDVLTTTFMCAGRETRRERRWLWLESLTASARGVAAEGRMSMVWAR